MGWRYVAGGLDPPAKTGRASIAEVVQEATLYRQLYALNLRDVAGVVVHRTSVRKCRRPALDQMHQATPLLSRLRGYRPHVQVKLPVPVHGARLLGRSSAMFRS